MKIKKSILLGLGLFLVAQVPAWSYTLSPCLRVLTYDGAKPSQDPVRPKLNKCKSLPEHKRVAVHEHMTVASLRANQPPTANPASTAKWQFWYMNDNQWPAYGGPARTYAIIFGTWWNDDPLMRSLGQGPAFTWESLESFLNLTFKQNRYPAAGRYKLSHEDHLARQSHLGQLQHLHFMLPSKNANATRDSEIDTTVDNALGWMEFAYEVATGARSADSHMPPELQAKLKLPSLAKNFGVEEQNVRVRTLFTHQTRDADIPLRDKRTPEVALGSMLHVLQDSFAPAHACRVSRGTGTEIQAEIVDIASYSAKDSDAHSLRDGYPDWFLEHLKSGTHVYQNDPVKVGAWLIAAVDRKEKWGDVEKYLRGTIFKKTSAELGEKCIDGTSAPQPKPDTP